MIACLNKLCKNLSKFIRTNAFSQINKYDIREYLKSIPTTIYDNMTTIPQLTRMSHSRLWQFLLERAGINAETKWTDIQGKPMNRLLNILLNDVYSAKGKTTFKEEFVTCGGVSLEDINMTTMESRHTHGLYFAGEVIDVDGVTGGFNFQAAWTTGFIAGRACAASLSV